MKRVVDRAGNVKASACLIRSSVRFAAIALATLGVANSTVAQAYRVTPVDTGPVLPGAVTPTHVKPDGTVVGYFLQGNGTHEFAWRLNATPDVPAGFTDLGPTSGWAADRLGFTPTIWTWTNPNSIVLGPDSIQPQHVPITAAIWWVDGAINTLPPLVASGSSGATATTPGGIVVGWASDGRVGSDGVEGVQGAVWYAPPPTGPIGAALPLGMLPGYDNSVAQAVNTYGTVVGVCFNTLPWVGEPMPASQVIRAEQTAFISVRGQMSELDAHLVTPGWSVFDVTSVRDNGVITAIAIGNDGLKHPVVLEPVGADLDGSGELGGEDVPLFFGAVVAVDPVADLNSDGTVDLDDAVEFMNRLALGLPLGATGVAEADGPVPSDLYLWYFLSQLAPVDPNAPPFDENGVSPLRALKLISLPLDDELFPEMTLSQIWNKKNPGKYHEVHNPHCYGCPGWVTGNPSRDGRPGFPGDDPNNPIAPEGGPGGDGVSGGDGGAGGNGAPGSNAKGGRGGKGAVGTGDSPGGSGGHGGRGDGTGDGGDGGNGGNGCPGGLPAVDGTTGGDGGSGGAGGSNGGKGGNGGRGGDAPGRGPGGGDGGRGGPGGNPDGEGGKGGPGGDAKPGIGVEKPEAGGNGGRGGAGGNGGLPNGAGGEGGLGGNGATGTGTGGEGGAGGSGGNDGRPSRGPGGDGGNGGRAPISDLWGFPGKGGAGDPPGRKGDYVGPG